MNEPFRRAALAVATALATQVHAQGLQIAEVPAVELSASAPAAVARSDGGASLVEPSHRGFIRCYQRGVRIVDEEVFSEPAPPHARVDSVRLMARSGHRLTLMPIGDSLCLVKTPDRLVQISGGTSTKSSSVAACANIAARVDQ